MHYVRSGLCVLGLLLSYAASACAESLTKVGVVLNFAADGGAAGFYSTMPWSAVISVSLGST